LINVKWGKKRNLTAPSLIDDLAKTAKLPTIVIPALDNNTQGQAAVGIQLFQLNMGARSIPV
jgi:hypothetical protein